MDMKNDVQECRELNMDPSIECPRLTKMQVLNMDTSSTCQGLTKVNDTKSWIPVADVKDLPDSLN